MPLTLRSVAHSEIGLVRKNNQDSGYASPTMLMVADGMGGAAAGDLASAVAIGALKKIDGSYRGEEMLEALAGAVQNANDKLADLVADDHALDGMGTTVCGALFDGEKLGVVHIGDSRGYRMHDGKLERLTHDHSWVQSLVDDGRITEEESHYHPHRSLLLKVLNGQPVNEPDLFLVPVAAGDRILFCSDGLCGLVSDEVIEPLLATQDLGHALADLTEAAHAGGGLDNITIIIADVLDEASVPVAEDDGTEATVPVVGQAVGDAVTLGAAIDRVVPNVGPRPIGIDDIDDEAQTDERGNPIPKAPAPASSRSPDSPVRYSTARRPRHRRTGLFVAIAAIVLALVLGSGGTYAYAQSRFYIGPSGQKVAIYQGVPGALLGLPLSHVAETSDVNLTDLPPSWQDRVRNGINVPNGGIEVARTTIAQLKDKSAQCIQQREMRAQATQTPTPSPTPSSTESTPATPASPVVSDPATASSSGVATIGPTVTPVASATSIPTPNQPASTPSTPDEC